MSNRTIEILVGLFMVAGLLGMLLLAFKVSGLTRLGTANYYMLTAEFDNIGGLKVRAPVRASGVKIGYVGNIVIDPATYRAKVTLKINNTIKNLPIDTAVSIFTEGLLGSNYISVSPGFDTAILKPNDQIQTTHSALILENLIGQLLFNMKSGK